MQVSVRSLLIQLLLATTALLGGTATPLAADGEFTPMVKITPVDPGIDDVLTLRLSIDVPGHLLVNFPRLGVKLGSFAVTGQRALEAESEVIDERTWVQQYRLAPEHTGDLTVPPLIITIQDPETLESIEVSTNEVFVQIASIVPADTDLRHIKDIRPPVALHQKDGLLLPWLLPATFTIVAIPFIIWFLQWRTVAHQVQGSPKPPHLVAMEALEKLRAEPLDVMTAESFHIRLAAVLRRYIKDRFTLPALRQTTEELLRDVADDVGPVRAQQALIARPLDQCDRVKFARHQPSRHAMMSALNDIATFIRQTSDVEPASNEATDAD